MALPEVGVRVVVRGAQRANAQLSGFRRALLNIKKVAAAAPVRTLTRAFGGLLRILPAVGAKIRSVGRSFTSFGRSITTFGSVLSTLGFRLASFISLPIGLAIGGMISQAAKFEEKMVGLITTIGLSRQQVEGLTERLLELGPALGIDLLELADATYITLSSTIRDSATALEIIEGSAKAAAIGLGEAESVAKLITAVIVAYGEENINAADALDILLAGVQRGALEADEMAEPMSQLIGLTSNLGVSFAELNAFVGTFGASGASASQSVTGMLGVMRAILNPSGEMKDALELMGVTVNDLRDSIAGDGLAVTLIGLAQEMDRLGIDVSDVFGRIQGLNAVMFLTGGATDEYLRNLVEIENGHGVLEASFAVTTQTTIFQWNQFKASIQAAAIVMGNILLPAVNSIIQALMPLVTSIAAVAKQHPGLVKVAVIFAILAATIGPLIIVSGLLLSSMGAIVTVLGVVLTAIGSLLSPIGLVIAAFAAAAIAIGVLFLGSIKKTAEKVGFEFDNMAERAQGWGRNILVSLARGMAQGAVAVVTVLIQVGNMIRGWLQGASPPKLLPDLPAWGANIINELLRGFTLADFGVFKELSSTLSSFFKSLPEADLSKEGIVPAIMGGREGIARAISEIKLLGSVTAETMAMIGGAFGQVSADIREYVQLMLEVAEAQAEVNRINMEFEAAVAPIDDDLDEINDRRQEIKDSLEEERLQKILADPRAPALAKELALMDLQEIALKKSRRALEDNRDTALEAAEAELAMLQERADLQKLLIDAQIENNSLMKEQAATLESLVESIKGLKDSIGDIAGGGGLGFEIPELPDPEEFGLASTIGDALLEQIEAQGDIVAGIIADIKLEFEPLLELWDEATDVWSDIFAAVIEFRDLDWPAIGQRVTDSIIGGLLSLKTKAQEKLAEVRTAFETWANGFTWFEIGVQISDDIRRGIRNLILDGAAVLTEFLESTAVWLIENFPDMKQLGIDIAEGWLKGLRHLFTFITEVFPLWMRELGSLIKGIDWFAIGKFIVTVIITGLKLIWLFLTETLPAFHAELKEWFESPDRQWKEMGKAIVNGIIDGVGSLSGALFNAVTNLIGGALQAAAEALGLVAVGDNIFAGAEGNPASPNARFPGDPGYPTPFGFAPVAAPSTTVSNNFNMGPINISNGMDEAVFEAKVRRLVAEAIST